MSSPPPEYGNKGVPYGQQPQQNYYPPPGQGYNNQPQQQGYYPPPQQQQPQSQTGFAPVVQSQPGQGVALTQMTSGIPPGLEYLSQLSSVNIYQVLHIEESKYAPPLPACPPPPHCLHWFVLKRRRLPAVVNVRRNVVRVVIVPEKESVE